MKITMSYRGQLALATGIQDEVVEIASGSTIGAVVRSVAGRHGAEFARFVIGDDGTVRNTLLIAVDGEQTRGEKEVISEAASEITLMPPIAGG